MKLWVAFLIAASSLALFAVTAHARLGYTLEECTKHYGKETLPSNGGQHYFQTRLFGMKVGIYVRIFEGTVDKIDYLNFSSGNPIPGEIVQKLLQENVPNTSWKSIPITTPRYGDDESAWIAGNHEVQYNATEWSNDRGTYFLTIENGKEPIFSL